MKGPNPFAFLEDNPGEAVGRKYESGVFDAMARACSARQPRVLAVHGGPGTGKTFLLRYFRREAEGMGMLAPYAKAEEGEDAADVAGRLYQETASLLEFRTQGAGAHPGTFAGLVESLGKGGQGKYFGTLVFIDDFDDVRKADEAAAELVRLAASLEGRRAVGFVLAYTRELRLPESPALGVLRLKPFDEHDAREAIDKALGAGPGPGKGPKMGEECLHSVMTDTGGNPRLLKAVCRHVYDRLKDNEKIINKGHYLAYLPYIMNMLSGEWFGRMYQATPEAERRILAVMAGNSEGMHVSDIARTLGRPLGPTTALVGRLLDRGQITRLDRGKYRIFAGLYARYVLQRGEGRAEEKSAGSAQKRR